MHQALMDQDVGQAQEMFTWLYRQNKDAVLLTYRGESHVGSPQGLLFKACSGEQTLR